MNCREISELAQKLIADSESALELEMGHIENQRF